MEALVVVDVQNDFLPSGALAVPSGDEIVPTINRLMDAFQIVVASQDWHPADHSSFAGQHVGQQPGNVIDIDGEPQILWPDHCVQHSAGASFASGLDVFRFDWVVRKGDDRRIDSYSAFFDNDHQRATGLKEWLDGRSVDAIAVCGLATDYCVKYTVLDGVRLGYSVTLLEDATRAVNLQPNDRDDAIEEMRAAGAIIGSSASYLS